MCSIFQLCDDASAADKQRNLLKMSVPPNIGTDGEVKRMAKEDANYMWSIFTAEASAFVARRDKEASLKGKSRSPSDYAIARFHEKALELRDAATERVDQLPANDGLYQSAHELLYHLLEDIRCAAVTLGMPPEIHFGNSESTDSSYKRLHELEEMHIKMTALNEWSIVIDELGKCANKAFYWFERRQLNHMQKTSLLAKYKGGFAAGFSAIGENMENNLAVRHQLLK